MYKQTEDGYNHINVYSKGKTELGRWLSNFAHTLGNKTIDAGGEWILKHLEERRELLKAWIEKKGL